METLAERTRFFVEAAARAGEFWLRYARRHQQDPQALTAELDNVLQAIAAGWVYEAAWKTAADLALRFHLYMINTGQWSRWERHLLHLVEASATGASLLTEALLRRCLAEVHSRLGHWLAAVSQAEQCVTLLRQVGERQYLGRGLVDLGHHSFNLGRWQQTEELAKEAWPVVGTSGDPSVRADALILQGRVCREWGQVAESARFFQMAVELALKAGDRSRCKSASNFLGLAYLQLGRLDEALHCFWQALDAARETGDRPGQGVILLNVGEAYMQMGNPDLALGHLQTGLAITRETDNRPKEAAILFRLGKVHLALGQKDRAVRYYEQALDIARQVGDQAREAEIQEAMTAACVMERELARAANGPGT
jgi:tetratricopeptide (TPR) repeat protein